MLKVFIVKYDKLELFKHLTFEMLLKLLFQNSSFNARRLPNNRLERKKKIIDHNMTGIPSSVKIRNGMDNIEKTIVYCVKKGTGRVETCRLVFLNLFCMMAYFLSCSWSNMMSSPALPQEKKDDETWAHEEHPLSFPEQVPIQCLVAIPVLVKNVRDLSCLEGALKSIRRIMKLDEHLLVVDDGSPLFYTQAIQEMCARHHASCLRFSTNHGPAHARNAALIFTRSHTIPIICFMDSDCMVESSDWITQHRRHQHHSPGITVGRTVSMPKSNHFIISRYHDLFGTLNGRQFVQMDAHHILLEDQGSNTLLYGPTCNFSINVNRCPPSLRFDAFHFRQAAFEDVEFCVRARITHRIPTYFLPNAVVHHDFKTSLNGIWKQFWRYGKGANAMIHLFPFYNDWLAHSVPISNYEDANNFKME